MLLWKAKKTNSKQKSIDVLNSWLEKEDSNDNNDYENYLQDVIGEAPADNEHKLAEQEILEEDNDGKQEN